MERIAEKFCLKTTWRVLFKNIKVKLLSSFDVIAKKINFVVKFLKKILNYAQIFSAGK